MPQKKHPNTHSLIVSPLHSTDSQLEISSEAVKYAIPIASPDIESTENGIFTFYNVKDGIGNTTHSVGTICTEYGFVIDITISTEDARGPEIHKTVSPSDAAQIAKATLSETSDPEDAPLIPSSLPPDTRHTIAADVALAFDTTHTILNKYGDRFRAYTVEIFELVQEDITPEEFCERHPDAVPKWPYSQIISPDTTEMPTNQEL